MTDRLLSSTVSKAHSSGAKVDPARCKLHLVYPPERRASTSLDHREIILGRDPGPQGWVITDETVSRRHAVLAFDVRLGLHTVRDLGSRNGTSADGCAVAGAARPLLSGSVLRLGDVLCVYEQHAEPSGASAESLGGAIPGVSAAMVRLRAALARAAPDPAPVLVIGETGTGKERIAEEIHKQSGRGGPFVPLNCAALSPQLVESQLFGHGKGAFTGAGEANPGLFRAADRGSLFLDEIGELASELQPKLLRALQEGEVLPVGSTRAVRVDVRVIAATNRELGREDAAPDFRRDLYARLSLFELRVPPLRERRADLFAWIDRLHRRWADHRKVAVPPPLRFAPDAAEALLRSAWPLNLRGLDRLVHDLAPLAGAGTIVGPGDLPSFINNERAISAPSSPPPPTRERADAPSREEFTVAFDELGGNVSALAKRFGRDRKQIYRWLDAYQLRAHKE